MRQPLLLDALVGATHKEHAGYESMHRGFDKIKEVALAPSLPRLERAPEACT